MKQRLDTYGAGGFRPGTPGNNLLSSTVTIVAGLGSDVPTILANGLAVAALHYAGPEPSPHAWTVNGAPASVPAVLDAPSGLMVSEIEVTAAAVGPVEITAVGASLTLQAI